MTYKLFLDDEREPVTSDFVIARSMQEATEIVDRMGCPCYISFDHDLGEDSLSGYKFAKWLVEQDIRNDESFIPTDFDFYVHSQNPVGKKNIECYLNNYLEVRKDEI